MSPSPVNVSPSQHAAQAGSHPQDTQPRLSARGSPGRLPQLATWLTAAQKHNYTEINVHAVSLKHYPSPPGLFPDPHLPDPPLPQERPRGSRASGGSRSALVRTAVFCAGTQNTGCWKHSKVLTPYAAKHLREDQLQLLGNKRDLLPDS